MEATKMQLVDWLDDLCVRFIINLPQEELESVERICFQIEEAQWFYEDFIRPLDHTLPSLPLKTFCLRMFKHCPLLALFNESQHLAAYETFLAYKTRVPVRGAILLNQEMDHVLLVRGWKKGASWSFPRGKINKDEKDLDCAVREAWEETGFNARDAGLINDEDNMKFIEVTMREQHMKLFVFRGVDMDHPFMPQTRKEISKIQWYKLSTLPGWKKGKQNQAHVSSADALSANKVYMVAPFLQPLKTWIALQRKRDLEYSTSATTHATIVQPNEEYLTDEKEINNDGLHRLQFSDYGQSVHPRHQPGSLEFSPASNADATDELKRLLSVGHRSPSSSAIANNIHPIGTQTADLLAMLNRSSVTSRPPDLLSQIQPVTSSSSTQVHRRDVSENTLPPYDQSRFLQHEYNPYAIQTATPSTHQTSHYMEERQKQGTNDTTTHAMRFQESVPHYTARGLTTAGQNSVFYSEDHDPQFSRLAQHPTQQYLAPPIVAKSVVVPPNDHATRLLDVFKSTTSKTANQNLATGFSGLEQSRQNSKSILPMQTAGQSQGLESRSRQILVSTTSSREMDARTPLAELAASDSTAVRRPQASAQQNALLDLFRKPSTPPNATSIPYAPRVADVAAPMALAKQQDLMTSSDSNVKKIVPGKEKASSLPPKDSVPLVRAATIPPEPVEMPAEPSPLLPKPKQLFDPKDGKLKIHEPISKLRTVEADSRRPRSSQGSNGPISATVSGPVRGPEFDSMKKRPRHNQSGSGQQTKVQNTPVQILKRPVTPRDPEIAPSSPAMIGIDPNAASPKHALQKRKSNTSISQLTSSSPRAAEKVKSPNINTPQILRRPKVEGNAQLLVPAIVKKDPTKITNEPEEALSSQAPPVSAQQNLLSIFSKPSNPGPPNDAASNKVTTSVASESDRKQALLSLFGSKLSTPSISSEPSSVLQLNSADENTTIKDKGVGSDRPDVVGSDNASDVPASDGIGSGASRTRSPTSNQKSLPMPSRKGSQAPMSPDDKGFLLNFLSGFAKSTTATNKPKDM